MDRILANLFAALAAGLVLACCTSTPIINSVDSRPTEPSGTASDLQASSSGPLNRGADESTDEDSDPTATTISGGDALSLFQAQFAHESWKDTVTSVHLGDDNIVTATVSDAHYVPLICDYLRAFVQKNLDLKDRTILVWGGEVVDTNGTYILSFPRSTYPCGNYPTDVQRTSGGGPR